MSSSSFRFSFELVISKAFIDMAGKGVCYLITNHITLDLQPREKCSFCTDNSIVTD